MVAILVYISLVVTRNIAKTKKVKAKKYSEICDIVHNGHKHTQRNKSKFILHPRKFFLLCLCEKDKLSFFNAFVMTVIAYMSLMATMLIVAASTIPSRES